MYITSPLPPIPLRDPSTMIDHREYLENPVEGDEGAWAADAGAAVDHDGPLLGAHSVTEGADESRGMELLVFSRHCFRFLSKNYCIITNNNVISEGKNILDNS